MARLPIALLLLAAFGRGGEAHANSAVLRNAGHWTMGLTRADVSWPQLTPTLPGPVLSEPPAWLQARAPGARARGPRSPASILTLSAQYGPVFGDLSFAGKNGHASDVVLAVPFDNAAPDRVVIGISGVLNIL